MKKSKYVINGSFLTETGLGVQRYAKEITLQLDRIYDKKKPGYDIEIVVPDISLTDQKLDDYKRIYKNINVVSFGNHTGKKWDQLDYGRYLKKTGAKQISLCNTVPLISKGGIVCIHDIVFKTHPDYFTEPGAWHEILFRKMMYRHACHTADQIITVSEFSKNEITKNYRLKNDNIEVIPNAWQHFNKDDIDESIFDENKKIIPGQYYYYLASLAPNKNLKWILENAKKYPQRKYVLSGRPLGDESGIENISNIICTGFVSDARARALMKNCKAFIFPSTFEGFGIPPMEALCMGAKIVLGDIPVLREVYGDAAYYVDCSDSLCDIDELIKKDIKMTSEDILNKYSWEKSAYKLAEILTKLS